jgi:hypothetical protein
MDCKYTLLFQRNEHVHGLLRNVCDKHFATLALQAADQNSKKELDLHKQLASQWVHYFQMPSCSSSIDRCSCSFDHHENDPLMISSKAWWHQEGGYWDKHPLNDIHQTENTMNYKPWSCTFVGDK